MVPVHVEVTMFFFCSSFHNVEKKYFVLLEKIKDDKVYLILIQEIFCSKRHSFNGIGLSFDTSSFRSIVFNGIGLYVDTISFQSIVL